MSESILAIIIKAGLLFSALMSAGLVFATMTLKPLSTDLINPMIRFMARFTVLISIIALIFLLYRLGVDFNQYAFVILLEEFASISIILQAVSAFILSYIGYKRYISLFFAFFILIGFILTGHISTKSDGWFWLGAFHLIFVSWWLGGLLIIREMIKKKQNYDIITIFSKQALFFIIGLIVSGLIITIVLLGNNININSQYTKWLLLKLVFVLMILALAAFNHWFLLPKIFSTRAIESLKRNIEYELLIMAAIFIILAIMTTQTMPEKKIIISLDKAPLVKSGDLVVSQYMMRASLGNVPTSVVYMSIENGSDRHDKLVSVRCTCAVRASLHRMSMNNNMMIMENIDNIELPPKTKTRLEPMGVHIMLHQTRHPLLNGRSETVILQFEKSEPIVLTVPIYEKVP